MQGGSEAAGAGRGSAPQPWSCLWSPGRSAFAPCGGNGPPVLICPRRAQRKRLEPAVEHLEQQLACSPAVYHRKGRKTRKLAVAVNCSIALFLGLGGPAARLPAEHALGNVCACWGLRRCIVSREWRWRSR